MKTWDARMTEKDAWKCVEKYGCGFPRGNSRAPLKGGEHPTFQGQTAGEFPER